MSEQNILELIVARFQEFDSYLNTDEGKKALQELNTAKNKLAGKIEDTISLTSEQRAHLLAAIKKNR
jgi:hypothetical protein